MKDGPSFFLKTTLIKDCIYKLEEAMNIVKQSVLIISIFTLVAFYFTCRDEGDENPDPTTTTTSQSTTNASPTISITNPVDNGWVGTSATIMITATDDVAIQSVVVIVDSGDPIVASEKSTNQYDIVLENLTDGQHTIQAIATDEDGESSTDRVTVTVDNTVPTLTITSPVNLATVGVSFVLEGTAADNHQVASVEVSLDGGTTYEDATGTTTWSYTASGLTDGSLTVLVRVEDMMGLQASSSITVTVDTNFPPVISSPVYDLCGNSVLVSWETNEGATSQVEYDITDTFSGSTYVPATDATADLTTHSIMLSGLTTGTTYYYRIVTTDSEGETTVGPTQSDVAGFWGTELIAQNVIINTGTVQQGGIGDVDIVIKNDGTLDSQTLFQVSVYLSSDNMIDMGDSLLTTLNNVGPVSSCDVLTLSGVPIHPATTLGTYYVWVDVDTNLVVGEYDETNNRTISTGTLTIENTNPPEPDLTAVITSPITATEISPDGNMDISFDIENLGDPYSSGFSTLLFLDVDSSQTYNVGDFNLCSYFHEQPVFTGSFNVSISCTVGGTAPLGGPYDIGIFVDQFSSITESNETNNHQFHSNIVTVTAGNYDLVITNITPPAETYIFGPLAASITITNQGTVGTTAETSLRLGLDPDNDAGNGNELELSMFMGADADFLVPPLDPGESVTLNSTFRVEGNWDPSFDEGVWYLFARVDPMDTIGETDETNNAAVSSSTANFVTGLDLLPYNVELESKTLSISGTGYPQTTGWTSITVTNLEGGNHDFGGPTLRFYYSTDGIIGNGDDVQIGTGQIGGGPRPPIGPYETITVTAVMVMDSIDQADFPGEGVYGLYCELDISSEAIDADESNNKQWIGGSSPILFEIVP